jgi:hypothetical protein
MAVEIIKRCDKCGKIVEEFTAELTIDKGNDPNIYLEYCAACSVMLEALYAVPAGR